MLGFSALGRLALGVFRRRRTTTTDSNTVYRGATGWSARYRGIKANGTLYRGAKTLTQNLPVTSSFTYAGNGVSPGSGTSQTATINVAGSSESVMAVIGHTLGNSSTGASYSSCVVVAQPSGINITASLAVKNDSLPGQEPGAAIYYAVLPSGTTSINITITLNASPFAGGRFNVSTIPLSRLNSIVPVGSGVTRTATVTSVATSIQSPAGGVIFVLGCTTFTSTSNTSFSGLDAYTVRDSASVNGANHTVGDSFNTQQSMNNRITASFAGSGSSTVIAASWQTVSDRVISTKADTATAKVDTTYITTDRIS